jgi:hypothetical protein
MGSAIVSSRLHGHAPNFSNDVVLVPGWSREINCRIHALAGGDPAVVNPSTLLRLPGSIAWPWKAGRKPELTGRRPQGSPGLATGEAAAGRS